MNPSFFIQTLGCKVNQYESQELRNELFRHGFSEAHEPAQASLIIINTCTVTAIADKKSRQKLRSCIRASSDATVVVTGCAVENRDSGIGQISGRVIAVPNRDKAEIVSLLMSQGIIKAPHNPQEISIQQEILKKSDESGSDLPSSRTRALLKIQDGCSHFCSYCIVPFVRGPQRSRPIEEVKAKALELADIGYREIVLTGIHLGAYGLDLEGKRALASLLEALPPLLPGVRLRMSSIEPADFTPEIIEAISRFPSICRHIHLPLQHASNSVLERMGRGYTVEEYRHIIEALCENLEDVSITTDLITGFPGETEEDFHSLLSFIEEAKYLRIHAFPFSPRKGTRAAHFTPVVPEEEKKRRCNSAIAKGRIMTELYLQRYIGKTVEVLIEGKEGSNLHGLSGNYMRVHLEGPLSLRGEIVQVKVEKVLEGQSLWGTLLKQQ